MIRLRRAARLSAAVLTVLAAPATASAANDLTLTASTTSGVTQSSAGSTTVLTAFAPTSQLSAATVAGSKAPSAS